MIIKVYIHFPHISNEFPESISPISKYPKIDSKERESQLWGKMDMWATGNLFWRRRNGLWEIEIKLGDLDMRVNGLLY